MQTAPFDSVADGGPFTRRVDFTPVISGALKASEAGNRTGAPPAFPLSANFARRSPLASYGRKLPQFRFYKWMPIAAAPALLGLVVAITLSAQPIPESASSSAVSHRTVSAASSRGVSTALLLSAIHSAAASKPAIARHAASTRLAKYTVRSGDTLSAIALRVYHDPGAWPVIYWANRNQVRWANSIQVGEVLTVPARPRHLPTAPRQLGPKRAPVAQPTVIEQDAERPASSVTSASAQTAVSYTGDSSFQKCVITRESGGNSQVMNSTGHYGLYQFSASTWAAYGGNPAEFGHASVAEQNRVFDNAIAAGGQFNWAPYDGC
jgi:LysM repeat protein